MTDRDRTAAENEPAPIRIAAEREGLHVAVPVADEGRGIPPDHPGHCSASTPPPGTGPGNLPIVVRLVR